MGPIKLPRIWSAVIVFAIALVPVASLAQQPCGLVGGPGWTNTLFQTVGGITYLTGTAWLPNCYEVVAGPVIRDGTNLTQVIYVVDAHQCGGVCAACVDCPGLNTHVSVLGALPAGNYVLHIWSWLLWTDPANPTLGPLADLSFTVPDSTSRTLTGTFNINGPSFRLAVEGVPGVRYVIQASATLTNWTSVATNYGGPFVWSEPVSKQPTNRFYRVMVVGP